MNTRSRFAVSGAAILLASLGAFPVWSQPPTQPMPAEAAFQETEIPGVTTQLKFLRQYNGVLHLGILFHNGQDNASEMKAIEYSKIYLVDPKSKKKYFPIKDAEDQYLAGPITDFSDGGRWFMSLPPKSDALMWVLFEAVPSGSQLDVNAPLMFPFEKVAVTESAPAAPQEEQGDPPPLRAQLISADRSEAQLKVRLKITNPGTGTAASSEISYSDVYVFDPQGKRRYPLIKDSEGNLVAIPKSDSSGGGRFFLNTIQPGGSALMALTFQAPPDSVHTVDMVIPSFRPFEAMPISGVGGAQVSGIAAAGSSANLEQTLKELNAEVTPKEIKVNLSADVLFDFDKADLKPQAQPELQKIAAVLKSYPSAHVLVEGHTDGKGTDAYNQPLSEKRAQSVADWLQKNASVNSSSVQTKGWGKSKPIAPNQNPDGSDNAEGRQKNRRVEVTIKKG